MAFTPLVENELQNTEWDLREHIDSHKFYGLYSDINSMAQKLNSLINSDIKNEFVFDQPHYNNTNFISNLSLIYNDKKANKFPLTYILSNFRTYLQQMKFSIQ